jgi:hypothetical protein
MKYILSSKEWDRIQVLINDASSYVDNAYVEAYNNSCPTGDIKYDTSIKRILSHIEEAQKKIQRLKDLTS